MSQAKRQAIKVLLVEDDDEIREIISLALEINWPEAKLVSTHLGTKGVEMASGENPDVVILDLGLPDITGSEVLRGIRAFSNVPVLILTVRGDEGDIVNGLEAGADDYMTKPFRQVELLSRMRVLTRWIRPVGEDVLTYGELSLDPATGQLSRGRRQVTLSRLEIAILARLIKEQGEVSTYHTLTAEIWGIGYNEETEALRVFIRSLRKKIEPDPGQPQVIVAHEGVGYALAKA